MLESQTWGCPHLRTPKGAEQQKGLSDPRPSLWPRWGREDGRCDTRRVSPEEEDRVVAIDVFGGESGPS